MKQKVLACNEMEKEDAIRASIALAKDVGIELTEADFADKEAVRELSENELEAVAGGLLGSLVSLLGSAVDLICNFNGDKN